MSYTEYRDMFLKLKNSKQAKYTCLSFDLSGSKNMDKDTRLNAYFIMVETVNDMMTKIESIENQKGCHILVRNNDIKVASAFPSSETKIGYHTNPCLVCGDSFHFYIYNGSIETDAFLDMLKDSMRKTENPFVYRFASGNFETTNYSEGANKYYVGYIISELSQNKENTIANISADDYSM